MTKKWATKLVASHASDSDLVRHRSKRATYGHVQELLGLVKTTDFEIHDLRVLVDEGKGWELYEKISLDA
jgi:hypothetical protein